jgi:hypothetical protein
VIEVKMNKLLKLWAENGRVSVDLDPYAPSVKAELTSADRRPPEFLRKFGGQIKGNHLKHQKRIGQTAEPSWRWELADHARISEVVSAALSLPRLSARKRAEFRCILELIELNDEREALREKYTSLRWDRDPDEKRTLLREIRGRYVRMFDLKEKMEDLRREGMQPE